MPSTMTHSYFAIDTYNNLNSKYKNKISNLAQLKLFSQGSDPFMFYNYLIGKKAKYYKNIQYIIHTTKTQDFFINLINYINNNNLNNNKEVLTYLYGNICHYFLDLYTHPFIIYKTGTFNKNNKETYKYNAKHQEMEYYIDIYLIEKREKIKAKNFKIYNHIFKYSNFSKELTNTINDVIKETYNIENISKAYIKSIKQMKNFFRIINYDKLGVKKYIYSIIDNITPNSIIKLKELSYHNQYNNTNYLNLEKNTWNHPSNKNETYTYSFLDLYELALKEATNTIIKTTDILNTKNINDKELKDIFKNLSYVTGKNCNKKLISKYFEY